MSLELTFADVYVGQTADAQPGLVCPGLKLLFDLHKSRFPCVFPRMGKIVGCRSCVVPYFVELEVGLLQPFLRIEHIVQQMGSIRGLDHYFAFPEGKISGLLSLLP